MTKEYVFEDIKWHFQSPVKPYAKKYLIKTKVGVYEIAKFINSIMDGEYFNVIRGGEYSGRYLLSDIEKWCVLES